MLVGIAGLGVIGGSIGLSLKSHGKAKVIGYDVDPLVQEEALKLECVDAASKSLYEFGDCDWVFAAVPPHAVRQCLDKLESAVKPGAIVTDCASVKGFINDWAAKNPDREKWFVGGHPMAGNEGTGPSNADASLFAGSKWIITPTAGTPADVLAQLNEMIRCLGANPVEMTAEDHDRHVALLSHVPHALAATLVQMSANLDSPEVAAGSWRDLTRVAGSNPELWQHIFAENKHALSVTLSDLIDRLADLKGSIDSGDTESIRGFFENARQIKRRQGGLK